MTSAELTEWMAYEQVHGPILIQDHLDWGFIRLHHYVVSLLGKPKGGRGWQIKDFFPPWLKEEEKPQDPRILGMTLESWARANH